MRPGLRALALLLCGAWLVAALVGVWALRQGRPLHYSDGAEQRLGADFASAPMLVRGAAVPVAELPGPIRGRVQPLGDGRLLYGRSVDGARTVLVVFDPDRPDLEPQPLAGLAGPGHAFAPALLADGGLLFTSDRPGGVGGFDLWHASRLDRDAADGPWFGSPRPLAGAVNSFADEVDPAPFGDELVFVRRRAQAGKAAVSTLQHLRAGLADLLGGAVDVPEVLGLGPGSTTPQRPGELLRDPAFSADGGRLWFVRQVSGGRPELRCMPRLGADFAPDLATPGATGGRALRAPAPGPDGLHLDLLGSGERPMWYRSQGRLVQPWWPGQWPLERALLLSMLGVAVLGLLLALGARWRHVDVITWFLLASALAHLLVYLWLNGLLLPEPESEERGDGDARIAVRMMASASAAGGASGADAAATLARSARHEAAAVTVSVAAPAPSVGGGGAVAAAAAPVGARRTTPTDASDSPDLAAGEPALRDAPEVRAPVAAAAGLLALSGKVAVSPSTPAGAPAALLAPGDRQPLPTGQPEAPTAPAAAGGAPVAATSRAPTGRRRTSVPGEASAATVTVGPQLRDAAGEPAAVVAAAAARELRGLTPGLAAKPVHAPTTIEALAPRRVGDPMEAVDGMRGVSLPAPALAGGSPIDLRAGRVPPGSTRRRSAGPVAAAIPGAPGRIPLRDAGVPVAGPVGIASATADSGLAPLAASLPVMELPSASGAAAKLLRRPSRAGSPGLGAVAAPSLAPWPTDRSPAVPDGRRRAAPTTVAAPDLYANRFGPRKQVALERFGGTAATERAVAGGLAYLADRQRADGLWGRSTRRSRKYGDTRIGKSGLCLLAFLGAGHLPAAGGEYGDLVDRAVTALLRSQDDDTGHFGATSSYSHGIATYALAECYALTGEARLRAPLQRAADWILRNQDGGPDPRSRGGWGYFSPTLRAEDGYARSSVTAWMVMALESSRRAGLQVPDRALTAASAFLVGMFDLQRGHVLYSKDPARLRSSWRTLPASTPAATFCLQLLAGDELPTELSGPALDFVVDRRPRAFERVSTEAFVRDARGHPYFYYYGTLACFLAGGERWQTWNQALREILPAAQRDDGSWPPIGAYAEDYAGDRDGDACYTTALAVLSLEVYYRYFTPLLTQAARR